MAAASVLTAAPAGATIIASPFRHAGSCTASGAFATCVASGTAWRPHRIRVHVSASPNQQVFVAWNDVCVRGTGAGSRSGSFTATTPVNRVIRHPYLHPRNCTVAADAQLQQGGNSIRVWITYRRWS